MSNPYYNYSNNIIGDSNDNLMGDRATKLGEVLTISDIRNESGNTVTFIAFVNSFTQNFQSNWNTQEALGRMDDIATFKNTTRTISVSWDVPAPDMQTAKENLQRCNALISMLYPTYTNADTAEGGSYIMSKPPMVRLHYSNLIANPHGATGLKGYITSLTWSPILEMGSFHSGGRKIYPKVISLSIEFTALHESIGTGGPTGYYGSKYNGLSPSSGYTKEGPAQAGVKGSGWPFGEDQFKNTRKEPPPTTPPEDWINLDDEEEDEDIVE